VKLRFDKRVHGLLKARAAVSDESLEGMCVRVLSELVTEGQDGAVGKKV
jgi:predicted HicB family RNase H-like nuclease